MLCMCVSPSTSHTPTGALRFDGLRVLVSGVQGLLGKTA